CVSFGMIAMRRLKLTVASDLRATGSFNRLMAIIPKLTHARSQALAIKGIYLVRENLPGIKATGETIIRSCADALIKRIHDHTDGNWMWFEDTITYNNGILPESLLLAGEYLNEPQYTKKGIETLRFLIGHTFKEDMYIPIGNASWSHKKGIRSQYDQQPEDPASMILALATAYKMTRNEVYFQRASTCFSWFRGNNSAHHAVFNPQTGGCHDSLREDGVNNNQGAESLIAYLISHHTMRVFRASS
ncbi:MAG: hypothetical protein NUW00_03015, partial [Candidatus Kaiserbacteria bacterium]|nr:hypothetical protein [Candidatus Kaiserbacteria bacterium]